MSLVAIPTSSCTVSIGEPFRRPLAILTQAELDALDMVTISTKEVSK